MGFRYIFFFILLFNAKGAVIQYECPNYCTCDVFNDYRRATCQDKKLVTVEIGLPPVVELLDISHNQIRSLEDEVFTNMHLANLKLLNLSYNQISQISLHSFEGLDNLKSMDLSFNSIQYFLGQWFFDLRSLRELYLRGNNLQNINEQPRIELPYLKVLDLSENKIAHLHPIIFTSLPNLEILDISGNFLIDLRVEIIRPLPNLRLLVADGNSLQCSDISFRFLRRYIKENDITYVGPCKKKQRLRPKPTEPAHFERMEMTKFEEKISDKYRGDNEVNDGRKNDNKPNQDRAEDKKSFTKTSDDDDDNDGDNEENDVGPKDNNGKERITKLPKKHNQDKTESRKSFTAPLDDDDENDGDNEESDVKPTDNDRKEIITKLPNSHNRDKMENRKSFTEPLDEDAENDEDNEANDMQNKNNEAETVTKPSHKSNKQKNNEETDEDEIVVPVHPRKPNKNHKKTTQKNGWMVDDNEENKKADNSKPNIKYVEVCNNKTAKQTKNAEDLFKNKLDKMAMKVIQISPSGFVVLSMLLGVMVGVIASNTGKSGDLKKRIKQLNDALEKVQQKYFPNAKNPFKKGGGGNNENLPKDDVKEEVPKEKKDPQFSTPPKPKKKDSVELNIQSDCSDCLDDLAKFKPRPKSRRIPEQQSLLDEEEPPLGSTPAMSKRIPPQRIQRSPRDSGSELDETLKPTAFPPRRDRSLGKSDKSDSENSDSKPIYKPGRRRGQSKGKSDKSDSGNSDSWPKSKPGRRRGQSKGKSDESDNEDIALKPRSRSGSPLKPRSRSGSPKGRQREQGPSFGDQQKLEGWGKESEGDK
uniref:Uncharacterized protein LOC114341663 n=1 Tax=Diabrotica virgifera virgifera TaxID=50390 RepID=A0A6P7GWT5_DIAVI